MVCNSVCAWVYREWWIAGFQTLHEYDFSNTVAPLDGLWKMQLYAHTVKYITFYFANINTVYNHMVFGTCPHSYLICTTRSFYSALCYMFCLFLPLWCPNKVVFTVTNPASVWFLTSSKHSREQYMFRSLQQFINETLYAKVPSHIHKTITGRLGYYKNE